ncbi:MAG: hypothetical protein ACLR8Y_00235 [Alistipes indistinctus]
MARIVVLGGGESGCGSAVLAKVKGFDVFLSDRGAIAPKCRGQLEEWRVSYEEGRHTEEVGFRCRRGGQKPGIPESAPIVKALRERGIPVVSEIEFAGRYTDGSRTIYCITGSSGEDDHHHTHLRKCCGRPRPERGPCGQHWAERRAGGGHRSILTGT